MMTTLIQSHQLPGAPYSTYRIGGLIQTAFFPESEAELVDILTTATEENRKLITLGWGGNTLIASAGISDWTIITRKFGEYRQIDDTTLEFDAGTHTAKISAVALKHGLSGAEYLIGIPGTVGGAVRMNAGATGQETSDIVESVRVFNRHSKKVETWTKEDLAFSYRKSAIDPNIHTVLAARFKLTPNNADDIQALMDKNINFRKTHHPTEPNGGSVFKNPAPDAPAGKLLDELGARGWTEGGVSISQLHCNFIVNIDNGTSLDVLKLMTRMKEAIKENYGYSVHPENIFMGDATPEEKTLWEALQKTDDQ